MNVRKTLVVIGAAAAIGSSALFGVQSVAAEDSTNSLVDKLVTKFNLNKDEVEQVFAAEHQERAAKMQQKLEERLAKALSEGPISEEQKSKILAKFSEEASFRAELRDKSDDERRTAMKQHRLDLQQWAADNDIELRWLHMGGPRGDRAPTGSGEAPIE